MERIAPTLAMMRVTIPSSGAEHLYQWGKKFGKEVGIFRQNPTRELNSTKQYPKLFFEMYLFSE
jgi:hypothetical protein